MKKVFCLAVFFSAMFLSSPAFARSTFFKEAIFFAGAQGDFCFASAENGQKAGGLGGGALLEAGLDMRSFQVSALAGFDRISSGGRIENLSEARIGAAAGFSFDQRRFSAFPKRLALRAPRLQRLWTFILATFTRATQKNSPGRATAFLDCRSRSLRFWLWNTLWK